MNAFLRILEDFPEGPQRDAFYRGAMHVSIWGRWERGLIAGIDDGVSWFDREGEKSPPKPEGRNESYDAGLQIGWEARRRQHQSNRRKAGQSEKRVTVTASTDAP